MRRFLAVLVSVLAIVGLVAPQAFAQAPAPKVTINGLVDFVTSAYNNATGDSPRDITDGGKDAGWYSRQRGVFTITGEIGKTKGVVALELDFHNGRTGTNFQDGGFGGNSGFDLEGDEKGQVEAKWLYLETPITGAGSLMPFIPVTSIGRFGHQPAAGHADKGGILFTGDFPGVSLRTTWAPNVRSTLSFVQIGEALDPVINPASNLGDNDNYAILASVEIDVFKGLMIRPTFTHMFCDNGCVGNSGNRLTSPTVNSSGAGTFARGGFDPANATQDNKSTIRQTIGFDAKWTSGPWSFAPTFHYQWGEQEVDPTSNLSGAKDVDINSWILDVIGGFRSGPLTLEARFMWTPGMEIKDCVQSITATNFRGGCAGGDDIRYYEPILNGTTAYWSGWSDMLASGIDYNLSLRPAGSGTQLGRSPSYDKYGRIGFGVAADYALTPALTLHAVTNAFWTDEETNRNNGQLSTSNGGGGLSLRPTNSGSKASYLGNEWNLGFTYRFAPNIAFDMIGAYLWAGDAYDSGRNDTAFAAPSKDADDAYKLSARLRVTW